jgi:2-oxoglutarate dehydrogenase E2 component (dihydrolipoamide succinyltransferase)
VTTQVLVPALGESISEATVMEWLVEVGSPVEADQDLVTLETDKVTVNVPSPAAGVLVERLVKARDVVQIGQPIARVEAGGAAAGEAAMETGGRRTPPTKAAPQAREEAPAMPAARRLMEEAKVEASAVQGTGRGGRLLKEDVAKAVAARAPAKSVEPPVAPEPAPRPAGREEAVPMSRLRKRIGERLVQAQQTAAILTTFNEIDMSAVMALRKTYQQAFTEQHGVKLGFISFFTKAVIEALKTYPTVNAEIRGDDIVYKHYYDIGVAVGGGRGLVVPVVRDADLLSFAGIERRLAELGQKAKDNRLSLEELEGGTFTISNGGVYGSLLSTPILNPPQVGILGLHKIEERVVAIAGKVEVRPMMYVALSYDHRLIDGREAVGFLIHIKERIEDPARILLET